MIEIELAQKLYAEWLKTNNPVVYSYDIDMLMWAYDRGAKEAIEERERSIAKDNYEKSNLT